MKCCSGHCPEPLREAASLMRLHWWTLSRNDDAQAIFHIAVASWLDDVAAGWVWDDPRADVTDPDGDPLKFEESVDSRALAVATSYLNASTIA